MDKPRFVVIQLKDNHKPTYCTVDGDDSVSHTPNGMTTINCTNGRVMQFVTSNIRFIRIDDYTPTAE